MPSVRFTINHMERFPSIVKLLMEGVPGEVRYVRERTCRLESTIRHDYEGGYAGTEYEHSLSCGHKVAWGNDWEPDYCPWCGAKVVE